VLVHHDTDARSDFSPGDAEALFKEARRRTRRRRLRRGFAVVTALGVAVLAYFASDGGNAGVVAENAGRPFVDVKAFGAEGDLAFISRGSLWALDGETGSLRRLPVPRGFSPASPTFSRDGRWLAYLVSRERNGGAGTSELWLARANGSDAHAVRGLVAPALVGWSPSEDVLAVTTDTQRPIVYTDGTRGVLQRTTVVQLVTPSGAVQRLVALPASAPRFSGIENAVWSPNGQEIAVSTFDGVPSGRTIVRAYPVDGAAPKTWFSIESRQRVVGVCAQACSGAIADLAGWWPKWGIGFWVFAGGMTHNSDSTPLELLTAPHAAPRLIAQTLSDGTTDVLAAGTGDELAVVASSAGPGRVYTRGKTVEDCTRRTLSCAPLPGASTWAAADPKARCPSACRQPNTPKPGAAGSGVSLDPTWSPDGSLLAYVKAPATIDAQVPAAWYGAHELFVWNRNTNATRKIADVAGISLPIWSRNGKQLLYVSNDGLWLAPLNGTPTEIEYPLFPTKQWKAVATNGLSYYGQIPWAAQFNWASP
jgi:dipeptidyl aminopeptidase/acylaminoacyl peptidase